MSSLTETEAPKFNSAKSLFQLMKFFPALHLLNASVYIDEDLGLFGSTINTEENGTLSFLFDENGLVIYSFIKLENGSLIQISGKASFKILEVSENFNKLIRLLQN